MSIFSEEFKSFYSKTLKVDDATEIAPLIGKTPKKVIRIIPSRFNLDKLLSIIPKNSNYTIISDDAIIADSETIHFLSHTAEFNEGKFYILSIPSYLVIRYLPINNVSYALDLCAAPGGKGLHLFDRFQREKPVILNEPSQARRKKMLSVLKIYDADHLPIIGIEGGWLCRFVVNEIPLIIIDAPCSGEAGLLTDRKKANKWSKNQTYQLAKRQFALLSAALYALKVGGIILYSTCAISPVENESVINRLIERFDGTIELMDWPADLWKSPAIKAANLKPISKSDNKQFNITIVDKALRFRAADFGEPFFACLIKKNRPIYPKRKINTYNIYHLPDKANAGYHTILIGNKNKKEFHIPSNWPALPPLPYISIGK